MSTPKIYCRKQTEILLYFVQNRWLLVEFIPCSEVESSGRSTNGMNAKQIWFAIKQSVLHNFGDTGWGAVGLSLTGECSPSSRNQCSRSDRIHSEILLSDNEHLYNPSCKRSASYSVGCSHATVLG